MKSKTLTVLADRFFDGGYMHHCHLQEHLAFGTDVLYIGHLARIGIFPSGSYFTLNSLRYISRDKEIDNG